MVVICVCVWRGGEEGGVSLTSSVWMRAPRAINARGFTCRCPQVATEEAITALFEKGYTHQVIMAGYS